ncbi:flagellar protein FliT [Chromobacterium piscinae]|uniref:flagellar protein FliT n=1 Tax=Chromobacterium piscinae TaxID=686831 RepID=UPI001E653CC3|nr:flagellar protein FliT [Chromobacterium piscinae]MCD5330047.1 flagellar protein FliT [Chromobacterium piscinae]
MAGPKAKRSLPALIDELEPLSRQMLEAASKRDHLKFTELHGRSEAGVQQLLKQLESAEEREGLSEEQRETLRRVLIVREETQRQLATWAGQIKGELRTLSQGSKLRRQYKG